MIFLLAIAPKEVRQQFPAWAAERLAQGPDGFRERFQPAVRGLERALQGQAPEAAPEARRLLGWTTGKHWLLQQRA